ncbi:receptor-type tyrosine-protein phosphatase F isoform X1 [Coregonus clupeaformis]|uniref:receptor-type tyrosine-protein phosphatase F isoform X1 n=1 Tax=Coregonus clupeaformis TaxID=59861 RepID=UPI001E1C622B|nr:receptor-type tyrosine-protein phosphatase F isoform X1 [Coregonus clupeaformis]
MISFSHLMVEWEPPEEPNGQIMGYRVYYDTDKNDTLSGWKKHSTEDSQVTIISELYPNIIYNLRVLGFTSVGDGPPSEILQFKSRYGVRCIPPRFSIPPTNHEVMPGSSVNLICVAKGTPVPYVKWLKGEIELTKEDEMPIGWNILKLTIVKESANYTCVAMSSLGMIKATAQVSVKALPKPPTSLIVTETTATNVTLSWDSGNPEPVSFYIIQYWPKTNYTGFQEVDGVATTSYSIGGLSPYSEYEFRVMAVNNIGRGPPSDPVETRMGEQAPSSPPLNVKVRKLSISNIMVQWEPPEKPNGQIMGYRVYYDTDKNVPLRWWKKHSTDDSTVTIISGLYPDATYNLRVLGFTSVGVGPPSDILQFNTPHEGFSIVIYPIPPDTNLPACGRKGEREREREGGWDQLRPNTLLRYSRAKGGAW